MRSARVTCSTASSTPDLVGMGPVYLNALLMDTLGAFLHKSKPLLDLVFQKLKGSLIFVLEFLQLLTERVLLTTPRNAGGCRTRTTVELFCDVIIHTVA